MKYIRWFQDIQSTDVDLAGGKGANLGEMTQAGLPIPPGFCLVAAAYRDFINSTGLNHAIKEAFLFGRSFIGCSLTSSFTPANATPCILK